MLSLKEMSVLSSVVGAAAVMAWRVQEGRTAVTVKKILIPPLGMATGFCMFLVPACRIPLGVGGRARSCSERRCSPIRCCAPRAWSATAKPS